MIEFRRAPDAPAHRIGSWRTALCWFALTSAAGTAGLAHAANPPLPFTNDQPSLVLNEIVPSAGVFPTIPPGGGASGSTLGFVYDFAGTFVPGQTRAADGLLLPISQNTALFSLLGTTYGGNGVSNFALPNLTGSVEIGAGAGVGTSPTTLGVPVGSQSVTLATNQLPPPVGAGQSYDNRQPSLPLTPLIQTTGTFPTPGGGAGASFIGQIDYFAGNFAPGGYLPADGHLLPINQNQALFSIIGTTYGGNGVTTFALPDLRGRVAVGATSSQPLGTVFGQERTTLTGAQLPANGAARVNNVQPSLAVTYLIATQGVFPTTTGGLDVTSQTLGEVVAFAGNFAPAGWLPADGRLLPINQNQALFSILGTTYGGDGKATFALPDLRGRTPIGSGTGFVVGTALGNSDFSLTAANVPAVPEPATWFLLAAGLVALTGIGGTRYGRQGTPAAARA